MNGIVDDHDRALLTMVVRATLNLPGTPVVAWIDTAFDGHLVFPSSLIQELQLESLGETEAILADGNLVALETFVCYLEWFGSIVPLQVVASEGKLPLLGTGLLQRRVLHVDYLTKKLSLS